MPTHLGYDPTLEDPLLLSLTEPACVSRAFAIDDGWQLADLVLWLATEGRAQTNIVDFGSALCDRLVALGLPLMRVRFGMRTLNPLVAAVSCQWERDGEVTEVQATHSVMSSSSYYGSPIEYVNDTGRAFRRRLDTLREDRDHVVLFEVAEAGATDYFALALFGQAGRPNGLATFATDAPGGFSDDDLVKLAALTQLVGSKLDALGARHTAESLLNTYLGPRTGQRVLNGQVKRGDGERIRAAMWFSDLRQSTALSEALPLPQLLDSLNQYFELVANAVTPRGGEILRFIGDAMLIVFAEDGEVDAKRACGAAADAAEAAFAALAGLNERREAAGEIPLNFGVGLHYGDVIYGNVGAPERLDFTVMGPAVNRTARLESLTKALGVRQLMSEEFARHVDRPTRTMGEQALRGVPGRHPVFALA